MLLFFWSKRSGTSLDGIARRCFSVSVDVRRPSQLKLEENDSDGMGGWGKLATYARVKARNRCITCESQAGSFWTCSSMYPLFALKQNIDSVK